MATAKLSLKQNQVPKWTGFVLLFLSVEHVASKHAAPPVGSSIPTLVSRGADPLNGAASKRPHSPSLEEQAKRLKETEKARIHIAWTHNYRLDSYIHRGGALQLSQTPKRWLHTGTGSVFRSVYLKCEAAGRTPRLKSSEITDLPVDRWFGQTRCCQRPLSRSQPGGI